MADVALERLKAGGKYYNPGDEVPGDLEDADDLRERGVIGSAADAKAQQEERDNAAKEAEEAQAEADEKQAEADALRNKASGILVPSVSVTDQEAAALNKRDEDEEEDTPSVKPTAAKSTPKQ